MIQVSKCRNLKMCLGHFNLFLFLLNPDIHCPYNNISYKIKAQKHLKFSHSAIQYRRISDILFLLTGLIFASRGQHDEMRHALISHLPFDFIERNHNFSLSFITVCLCCGSLGFVLQTDLRKTALMVLISPDL